jgi:hypothetical protein
MKPGGHFYQHQMMGGSRFPPKFPIKQEPFDPAAMATPALTLYRCSTGKNKDVKMESGEVKEKDSISTLELAYKALLKKDIKDSLTSFISNIPGDFENHENPEGMLRNLIDRPPIGGREFLPISESSLLGFRLLPGSLPEQYQLDPPTSEPVKHHKKKKKHKHKYVSKMEDPSLDNYSPHTSQDEIPPANPCDFIKSDQTTNLFPPPHQPQPIFAFPSSIAHLVNHTQHHTLIRPSATMVMAGTQLVHSGFVPQQPGGVIVTGNKLTAASLPHPPQLQGYQVSPGAAQMLLNPGGQLGRIPSKPKKKKHENGDGIAMKKKKKDKKDKRKKKHHIEQMPTSMTPSVSGGPTSSHSGAPPPLLHNFSRPP